jgi:hypothetical protein
MNSQNDFTSVRSYTTPDRAVTALRDGQGMTGARFAIAGFHGFGWRDDRSRQSDSRSERALAAAVIEEYSFLEFWSRHDHKIGR